MQATLLGFAFATLAACASQSPISDSAPVAAVIVKPRIPSEADVVLRTARSHVGGDAGLRYVRPLAGGAHLLYLTAPATADKVPALIERLRASDAFQYVELDSTMKAQ